MIAITTKYLPATDTKGTRIKATAYGEKPVIVAWDYNMNAEQNHLAAAQAFATAWFRQPMTIYSGWIAIDTQAHIPVGGAA